MKPKSQGSLNVSFVNLRCEKQEPVENIFVSFLIPCKVVENMSVDILDNNFNENSSKPMLSNDIAYLYYKIVNNTT